MNTKPPFPSGPVLRLPRRAEAPVAPAAAAGPASDEQAELHEDWSALRERERNLQAYEERLRAWQAEIDAGRTAAPSAPAGEDPGSAAAWEKFHRARQLLETEQANLRDGRALIAGAEAALKQRESAVAVREAAVAAREKEFATTRAELAAMREELAAIAAGSTLRRVTSAPFQMARSVFGGSK